MSVSSLEGCSEEIFSKHGGVSMVGTHVVNLTLVNDTTGYSIDEHQSKCGGIGYVFSCDGKHI